MSHENVDVVRKPAPGARAVEPHARSAAPAPLPSACRCVLRLIATLPPASRIRQAALWRAVRLAVEAYNRRDLDGVVIGCHPNLEY